MSRLQLALNVSDLDAAIDFYSKLFDAKPAKVRDGYANFAIDEPPLKLILMQGNGVPGSLNHLGVEVFSTEDVAAAQKRLELQGLSTVSENGTCCYAEQEKIWVDGPDARPWEIYTVLADADSLPYQGPRAAADGLGCATAPESEARCCG
jgi:predicted enzyme related to lactoylglutathione lyase